MKNASWLLSSLFAGLLIYAFIQVPAKEPTSALSVHISSRYQQRSAMETGIHSQALAILADYRSLDLLALAALLSAAALGLIPFFNQDLRLFDLFPSFHLLVLGVGLSLAAGFLGLWKGSNFLDYEALAQWVGPLSARLDGALILLSGTFLLLAGLLALWNRWFRSPEGSGGR